MHVLTDRGAKGVRCETVPDPVPLAADEILANKEKGCRKAVLTP